VYNPFIFLRSRNSLEPYSSLKGGQEVCISIPDIFAGPSSIGSLAISNASVHYRT
jgi:hypothetical protein